MKKALRVMAVLGVILFLFGITGCGGGDSGGEFTSPPTLPGGQEETGWRPGIIHAHSRFSDGNWTPEQLVSRAKDAGACFLVVTDHYEQIDGLYDCDGEKKWGLRWFELEIFGHTDFQEYGFDNYRSRFSSQTSSDFVVILGAEIRTRWATDSVDPADSHTLVLGNAAFKDDILFELQCEADTQQAVINRLNEPELNLLPVAAHPSLVRPYALEWAAITNCQFDPMGANGIKGFEFFNDGSTEGYQRTLDWYLRLLRQGNDVFVTSGCDSHYGMDPDDSSRWTRKTWVYCEGLNQKSLLEAMAQGHTYAADDGASFEDLNYIYIPGFQVPEQDIDQALFEFNVKFESEVIGDKTVRIYRDGELVHEGNLKCAGAKGGETIHYGPWEDTGVEGEHKYVIEVEGALITSPIKLKIRPEPSDFNDTPGEPIWVHTWGGSNDDRARAQAVDGSGNIYLAGETESFGAGSADAFLLKYSSAGTLLWQKTWGGGRHDRAEAVAVDASGNVYVAGETETFGLGERDLFLLKYDSFGNLLWQKNRGGGADDSASALAVDESGNVYVAGYAYNYAFGQFSLYDALLLKYDSHGNLVWQKTWQRAQYDFADALSIDGSGNIYVAGYTATYGLGVADAFLLKYASDGTLLWDKLWDGEENDHAYALSTDASGNIYVAGGSDMYGLGYDLVFLLKYDSSGNLLWQKEWWGIYWVTPNALCVDGSGNVYVGGANETFESASADVFILKYDSSGNLLWQKTWEGSDWEEAFSLYVDRSGKLHLAGAAYDIYGAWVTSSGKEVSIAVTVRNANGTETTVHTAEEAPSGTETAPEGVEDVGGGRKDALVMKLDPSQL